MRLRLLPDDSLPLLPLPSLPLLSLLSLLLLLSIFKQGRDRGESAGEAGMCVGG